MSGGFQWNRYIARVTANDDTQSEDKQRRGRIKVSCPDLTGVDKEIPEWIEPVFDWGWFYIPDIDEMVEIEVRLGSPRDEVPFQTSFTDIDARWRSKRHWVEENTQQDKPNADRPIPEDFLTNFKRRGFATPMGHILIFDDSEDDPSVRLTWHRLVGEEDKFAFINFDADGSITLANQEGTMIYMDAKNGAFSIIDQHGNTFSTDDKGGKIIDKFGNFIELKDGAVQIMSGGAVEIGAANEVNVTSDICNLKSASEVNLGDAAAEAVVKGDTWKTLFDGHKHPTGVGPSGPPVPGDPIPSADCLSEKVTTE